jgi:cell division protein FtsX
MRAAHKGAYFARTALRGMRASWVTSAIAIATIGVTLVLVGAFGLLLRNMEELLERFGSDLRVTAYLEPGLSDDARRELAAQVGGLAGVAAVDDLARGGVERFRRRSAAAPRCSRARRQPAARFVEIR